MELVKLINNYLESGGSISSFEREYGYGKDTIRKKINRLGYVYIKNKKKFVLQEKTIITQESNERNLNKTVLNFNNEELEILKKIIDEYKRKNEKIKFEGEIIIRSFRTYKLIIDKFIVFCKDNDLKQQDALAKALNDFMKNYEIFN